MVNLDCVVLSKGWAVAAVSLMIVALASTTITAYGSVSSEYVKYVHDFIEPSGSWTFVEKPLFPIVFNDSQIMIGQNWSIVCPLVAGYSYHAYCYGKWINNGSQPLTDYDILVYDPRGVLAGNHTESAGLPEHLGISATEPFFVPQYSGNYTFVICNDAKESNGAQQATLMLIEDKECNVWHEKYVEGKDASDLPVFDTSYAYEFVTNSSHVEVWIDVPESLDMYEARLYLMADPKMVNYTVLSGLPLAWEYGLYGDRNITDGGNSYGGYNIESKEYRGVAYASCEDYGQEMLLNWTSPHTGKSLYHLVLIGEKGSGTIRFMVKTQFGNASLMPVAVPLRLHPEEAALVTYVSNSTNLTAATLEYSANNWSNLTTVAMDIVEGKTCNASIPEQTAGTNVSYRIRASDQLENILSAAGNYSVKYETALNMTLDRKPVHIGENMTLKGIVTPELGQVFISVMFSGTNETKTIKALTLANGSFVASLQAENVGTWQVQAIYDGNNSYYASASTSLTVKVEEQPFLARFGLYIGGGTIGAIAAGIVVYLKKFRE